MVACLHLPSSSSPAHQTSSAGDAFRHAGMAPGDGYRALRDGGLAWLVRPSAPGGEYLCPCGRLLRIDKPRHSHCPCWRAPAMSGAHALDTAFDWKHIEQSLDTRGYAVLPWLLDR